MMTYRESLVRVRYILSKIGENARKGPLDFYTIHEIKDLEGELDQLEEEAAILIDNYMARQFEMSLNRRRARSA